MMVMIESLNDDMMMLMADASLSLRSSHHSCMMYELLDPRSTSTVLVLTCFLI